VFFVSKNILPQVDEVNLCKLRRLAVAARAAHVDVWEDDDECVYDDDIIGADEPILSSSEGEATLPPQVEYIDPTPPQFEEEAPLGAHPEGAYSSLMSIADASASELLNMSFSERSERKVLSLKTVDPVYRQLWDTLGVPEPQRHRLWRNTLFLFQEYGKSLHGDHSGNVVAVTDLHGGSLIRRYIRFRRGPPLRGETQSGCPFGLRPIPDLD
jgi:hypothetical protein